MYPSYTRTSRVGRRRCIEVRGRSLVLARQGLTYIEAAGQTLISQTLCLVQNYQVKAQQSLLQQLLSFSAQ